MRAFIKIPADWSVRFAPMSLYGDRVPTKLGWAATTKCRVHNVRFAEKLQAGSLRSAHMDYQHITKGGIEVKFMTLAGLLLTLVVGVAARPASKHSSASAIKKATEEVLRIDQERADALVKNDTDQLDRIMADDCTYVHPNGKSETKQEVIAGLKAQDRKYESIERDD